MREACRIEDVLGQIPTDKPLLLAFDRDGTLVPYADHPEDAIMSESLKASLVGLSVLENVNVALVSARSIAFLEKDFEQGSQVILAGNYGLEVRFPPEKDRVIEAVQAAVPELAAIKEKLLPLTDASVGAILEDHSLSLCLHWHPVDKQAMKTVNAVCERIRQDLENVRFNHYPTSYEFFPDIDWTKADGLEIIRNRCGYNNIDSFSLFAGDTDSDEPGFVWANALGGLTIRVGDTRNPSVAKCRFERPVQVDELLSQLLTTLLNGV